MPYASAARIASSARSIPAPSTSRWVTARRCGRRDRRDAARPPARSASTAPARPRRSSSKITMLVSTAAGSIADAGDAGEPVGQAARVGVIVGQPRRGGDRARTARPRTARRPGACRRPASCESGARARSRRADPGDRPSPRARRAPWRSRPTRCRSGAARSRSGRPVGDRGVPDARAVEVQRQPARARARRRPPRSRSRGQTVPPPRLCVFSTATSRVRGRLRSSGRHALLVQLGGVERSVARADLRRTARPAQAGAGARFVEPGVRAPPDDHLVAGPAVHAAARSGWPSSRWARTAPPPCPRISAARASSARAVGSSPQTSSPTSAPAIAARIAGGRARDRVGPQIDDHADILFLLPRGAVQQAVDLFPRVDLGLARRLRQRPTVGVEAPPAQQPATQTVRLSPDVRFVLIHVASPWRTVELQRSWTSGYLPMHRYASPGRV